MGIVITNPTTLQEMKDQVVDGWRTMKDERASLESEWIRCLMAYLCKFDKSWAEFANQANRSHRYLSLLFDAIETVVPQLAASSMPGMDWLDIAPQREGFFEDDDIWAENMRYLLLYQMTRNNFIPTFKMAIRSLGILGNCPWAGQWAVQRALVNPLAFNKATEQWIEDSRRFHQERLQIAREYADIVAQAEAAGMPAPPPPTFRDPPRPPGKDFDVVYQGPKLQIGSIFNYVEEQHPNDRDQAIRIMRSWRTHAYLKKMGEVDETGYRMYENLNKIADITSEDKSEDNVGEDLMKMALHMQLPHGKEKVLLKAQYGTFEIKKGMDAGRIYQNYIVVVANDNTVIRAEPSPLYSGKSLVNNARFHVLEGAVYGIGLLEKALDEQDTANAVHNQLIDAVNVVIQPELEVVEEDLARDQVMAPSGPGVRHYVNKKGTITAIPKNFTGLQVGWQAVSDAIARVERITGAINTQGNNDESATLTARNTGVIATKHGARVEDLEDELLTPFLNMCLEMNGMNLTTDQVFQITQDDKVLNVTVPPEQIMRGGIARARGSVHVAEKSDRIEKLLMAIQLNDQRVAQGLPTPVNDHILWRRVMIEILGEAGEIIKSKENYLQEIEQFKKMMAEQRRMEAANAGAGQAGRGPGAEGQMAQGENGGGAAGGVFGSPAGIPQ